MKYLLRGVLLFLIAGSVFLIAASYWPAGTPPQTAPVAPLIEGGRILPGELVATPANPKPTRLEVIGSGPAGPLRIGERFYGQFRLKNAGTEEVWVVGSLDGSPFGRAPECLLEIRDEAGEIQKVTLPGICGEWGPLGELAFEKLKPGGVLERPLASILPWWRPTRPGTYTITLTYDSTTTSLQRWAGATRHLNARCRELLPLVPKGKFVSNPVRITVIP
ncbi:MAG TPA: hypothetical protein VNM14_21990 [Planctomycetota bacterium]|nr:hypothetical protein [Planctomycetota bacterium]